MKSMMTRVRKILRRNLGLQNFSIAMMMTRKQKQIDTAMAPPPPRYPNYNSIPIVQDDSDEAVSSATSRISTRRALSVVVLVGFGFALTHLVGHESSPFFLYGPLLGPYLDGDGSYGRRKAVKTLLKLSEEIEGEIFFHNDAEFCDASEVWQQGLAPPLAVIEVANEADIQLSMPVLADIYLKRGVPFRVRSGGHSYAGYSTVAKGIVLSLQRLNHFKFDNSSGVATIQPAVTVQDLLDGILVPEGYGGVTGECPGVAEGGFVLGGGYGFLARKYSLGADNMLSARVVLVDGSVVVASETESPDIFWALRGAGQNFLGVVTLIEYQLHPSQDTQLVVTGKFPLDPSLLTTIGKKSQTAPGEFGFLLEGGVNKHGRTDALLTWFDQDDAGLDTGEQYINQEIMTLLSKDTAKELSVDRTSWSEMTRASGNLDGNLVRAWTGFLFAENNTEEVWSKIIKKLMSVCVGNPYLLVDIELWGGAIAEKKPEDTAFFFRDAVYNVGLVLLVPANMKDAEKIYRETIEKVDKKWAHIGQHLEGVYTNYIMESLPRGYAQQAYWGGNVKKLQQIKDTYDQKNVLHHPQSVPPAHPSS